MSSTQRYLDLGQVTVRGTERVDVEAQSLGDSVGPWREAVGVRAAAPAIPAEFLGYVRVARARLTADAAHLPTLLRPITEQFEADARRGRLTPWVWARYAAQWNEATDSPERVAFHPPDPAARKEGALAEDRATASELRFGSWSDGQGGWPWEPGVDLVRYTLTVKGKRVAWDVRSLVTASTHALARRMQRGGGTIVQAVADMASAEPWSKPAGCGKLAPVAIPTTTGVWLGAMLHLDSDLTGPVRIPGLRTWLHDDDLRHGQLALLRSLRELGPGHGNTAAMIRQFEGCR
jgi:hypothetical protein